MLADSRQDNDGNETRKEQNTFLLTSAILSHLITIVNVAD